MRRFRCALLAILFACGASANATVFSAGTYTFNLDFTAYTPYASAFNTIGGTVSSNTFFNARLFTGLDGTGNPVTGLLVSNFFPNDYPFLPTTVFSIDSGVRDGLFSLVLTVSGGTVDLDPFVVGVRNADRTTLASVTLPQSVPEPATLALLGLGLAGLALTRRRKSH